MGHYLEPRRQQSLQHFRYLRPSGAVGHLGDDPESLGIVVQRYWAAPVLRRSRIFSKA